MFKLLILLNIDLFGTYMNVYSFSDRASTDLEI